MWVSQGYQEYQEGRKLPKLVFMSPHGLLSFHAGGGGGRSMPRESNHYAWKNYGLYMRTLNKRGTGFPRQAFVYEGPALHTKTKPKTIPNP